MEKNHENADILPQANVNLGIRIRTSFIFTSGHIQQHESVSAVYMLQDNLEKGDMSCDLCGHVSFYYRVGE